MPRSSIPTSACTIYPFSSLSAIREELDPSGLACPPLTLGNGWEMIANFQPDQGKALKAPASLVKQNSKTW